MRDLAIVLEDRPGALAEMGEVVYSDHDHRLVLVVDDLEAARRVADAWSRNAGLTGA